MSKVFHHPHLHVCKRQIYKVTYIYTIIASVVTNRSAWANDADKTWIARISGNKYVLYKKIYFA